MQFTLVAVLALAAAATAKPTSSAISVDSLPAGAVTVYKDGVPTDLAPRDIAARDNAGVFLCNDINFSGYCVHIVQPQFQCINLSGDLNDQVSSLGPDSPYYCLFYSAFNCNDSEGHFGTFSPGYKDLRTIGWNDKISSYICHPN